ncbi:hypothetical protein HUJ05_012645 [Dendroctonus ponderosae]|nr:hypothetical protein HUJ05_012645 [Dendroctonus ponderosae]
MALIHAALIASALLGLYHQVQAEYIPPGPLYRCPKEKLLLHPCSCDVESDQGLWISCNNTNIASMSLALNNLATFELPIETLTIKTRLFGSLLYKLKLRVLRIEETPLEIIDEFSFLGVNNTLNELHIVNSSLLELPLAAFKILGNITVLNIDGHNISDLPKEAFFESEMSGKLLKLHIVNGHLNTPPIEALQPLRKLKTLDLHGNRIKELKRNQFKGLRDVEILDLSFNMIPKIDSSHLADLTKMSWLNVSHNSLKELTRGAFARNTVLRVLNMSFNQIKKLDSNSFRGMRFLRRLFLSDNLIGDVGRGTFGSLQRIGTIDLARNLIKKVDYQMFFQLNFIELLDLSENQITEVQKLAFKDLYLSTINMAKNQISTIESGAFENCANVTKLDLSENQLRDIPKRAFDETTYATELQLAHNFFTSMEQIPLHNMTGLKILNVSHNQIETVPKKTFPKLYELHTIDLSYNNLSDIFNSVFTTLFSLRTLDLSHNSLEAIKPSTFGPLPTLLRLDMSFNRLETIAKSALTRLASTRELIVSHNKLSALFILPISTSHLDLSHNEFETIPPKLWPSMNSLLSLDLSFNRLGDSLEHGSFTNLLTLQKLNLSYNGLTRPPWTSISELTALQYLYVQGNNLTTLRRNAFGKVPVMFELDLSNNAINNVSTRAFEGLLQLIHLKMNNNNISVIPNGAFQGLVSLTDLDLSQNRLVKLDNKTNGIFDDCLSLERLNLSHNRITFITRKMFPSNPYIPYKLKQIDLSYNFIPVITYDLTFGTSKLEKLNMSHNAIADVRKGVIGNLTSAKLLDLSYNKLHDLTSDPDFFRLPPNISSLLLAGEPTVQCTRDQMRVEVPLLPNTKSVYIQGLRDYPDPACRPHTDATGKMAVLELDLNDVYRCAVTRVVNKQTGKKIYYQTLVVERMENDTRDTLNVKCSISKDHVIARRQVFPPGFVEPTDLETTTSLIGMAPQPNITVGVRQSGRLVTGELNVSPGTPLQMEISLDSESTPIYGLLVTHMQVSDTKAQEETIIYNGCSADPYLFENFNTVDGDNLVAKFRAFKFPESTYVQFKGTVNVCLDKCKGVECSDGSIGYGRRKRAISALPADPNKIFEVTITSFIKVNYDDDSENLEELVKKQTKMYNNKKLIVGDQRTDDVRLYADENGEPRLVSELKEDQKYTAIRADSASSSLYVCTPVLVMFALIKHLILAM